MPFLIQNAGGNMRGNLEANLELKIAILRSGRKAYEVAGALGWSATKISQIVTGIYIPDEAEKIRIANVLGVPVQEIFPTLPVLT